MPTTAEEAEVIYRAIHYLTSVCDGAIERDSAGFNKTDAHLGHGLSLIPPDAYNESIIDWGRRTLPKYRKQLEDSGIPIDTIRQPQVSNLPKKFDKKPRKIAVSADDEGNIIIVAPASDPISYKLQKLVKDGAPVEKREHPGVHWFVPAGSEIGTWMRETVPTLEVTITARTQEAIDSLPEDRRLMNDHTIELGDNEFVLSFPKQSLKLREEVKALNGSSFVFTSHPYWVVPCGTRNAQGLQPILETYNFHIGEGVAQRIEEEIAIGTDRRVFYQNGMFWIWFKREDTEVMNDVRNLPMRTYEKEPRPHWEAPGEPRNVLKLVKLIENHHFWVEEQAKALLDAIYAGALELPEPPPELRLEWHEPNVWAFSPRYNPFLHKTGQSCGASWKGEEEPKHWEFFLSKRTADPLLSLIGAGWHADEELVALIERTKQEAVENYKASLAAETDQVFEVNGSLYPFQNAGVAAVLRFTERLPGALLGDEMGLGKSPQCLAYMHHRKLLPAVLVVPNHMRETWADMVEKFTPWYSYRILYGIKPDKKRVEGAEILIVSYATVYAWVDTIIETLGNIKLLSADEAHSIKNKKSRQSRAVFALAQHSEFRLALTGTPIPNRTAELWPIIEYIGAEKIFGSWPKFAYRYCNGQKKQISGGKNPRYAIEAKGATNSDELNRVIRENFMVRRLKSEVMPELPEFIDTTIVIKLSNREEYRRAEEDFAQYLEDEGISEDRGKRSSDDRAKALVKITALRRLCAVGKIQGVIEWLQEFQENTGEKLVMFIHHKEPQDALRRAFPDAVTIYGEDTTKTRDENKKRFQDDPDVKLFLGSLSIATTGITLTAASHVALFELPWRPGDEDQARDRIRRIGQTANGLQAWYFRAPYTIDDTLRNVLDSKRRNIQAVLDGKNLESEEFLVDEIIDDILKRRKEQEQNIHEDSE